MFDWPAVVRMNGDIACLPEKVRKYAPTNQGFTCPCSRRDQMTVSGKKVAGLQVENSTATDIITIAIRANEENISALECKPIHLMFWKLTIFKVAQIDFIMQNVWDSENGETSRFRRTSS